MTRSSETDTSDARRLRDENEALNEQIKLLVRTEQRLYRSQSDLDREYGRVRALAEFALHCAEVESVEEIVEGGALLLRELFHVDDVTFVRFPDDSPEAAVLRLERGGPLRRTAARLDASQLDWLRDSGESVIATIPATSVEGEIAERLRAIERALDGDEQAGGDEACPQVCIPVRGVRGALAGLYLVGRRAGSESYYKENPQDRHLPFFELLANHLARAIRNAELTRDLRERSRELADANRRLMQSLARLEVSERRFRQLAEHVRVVFWILDPHDDRMTYLSPAFYDVWGRDPEAAANPTRAFVRGIHADDRGRVLSLKQRHLVGHETNVEYRVVRPDGTERWIWDCGYPVRDAEGRIELVCGIAEDITERRRTAEELGRLQRLETAGKIAGQIAHDFNNLLAPLTVYPQLLESEFEEGSRARAMLATMRTAAGRIADINQQLLTLGRRGHYDMRPLCLNRLVRDALEAMGLDPTVRVDLDLSPDLLPIRGGASQLTRVVTNLCTNACDAMDGGGRLTIRTENLYLEERVAGYESVGPGEFVRMEVTDDGAGIAADAVHRVFDPFFSTKEMDRERGSGLGLSVVHGVVADHGGSIDVRSEIGVGSTFSIYFPVSREPAAVPARDPVMARGFGERVLLVDDDPLQREVLGALLDSLGYEVATASSGEEAIDRVADVRPHLVLLDMVMRGIDGTETLRRVLKRRPDQKVILVSGYARIERVEAAQRLGARGFLAKPLTRDTLARALREALDGREGR